MNRINFDKWYEENEKSINGIIEGILESFKRYTMYPKSISYSYCLDEEQFREDMLCYLYKEMR